MASTKNKSSDEELTPGPGANEDLSGDLSQPAPPVIDEELQAQTVQFDKKTREADFGLPSAGLPDPNKDEKDTAAIEPPPPLSSEQSVEATEGTTAYHDEKEN